MTRANRRLRSFILAGVIVLLASVGCQAASDLSVYSFGNLVVFDSSANDGTLSLNVVALDDAGVLRVTGHIVPPGHPSYVSAYSSYKDTLIVLLWDQVQVYVLADPATPALAATFPLKNRGSSSPGSPVIEKIADNKFLLIGTINTTELLAEGSVPNWRVTPLPVTAEFKAKMVAALTGVPFDQKPVVVKESGKFRYELVWKDKPRKGAITHSKYLRKVDKASGLTVSELLLGRKLETID